MRKLRVKARAVEGSEKFGETGTGKAQVGFQVQIVYGELQGNVVPWYGFFTESSGKRTLESLQIAGWKADDDGWRAFGEKRLPGLGTTEFELELEEEDDRDESGQVVGTRWKAGFINRIGVAMRKEMDAAQAKDFAARMRAQFGDGSHAQQSSGGSRQQQGAHTQQSSGRFNPGF